MPPSVDLAAHGGEAEDAGAARQPQQEGLGLVVAVMGGEEMAGAGLARGVEQEPVARRRAPPPRCRCPACGPSSARMRAGNARAVGNRRDDRAASRREPAAGRDRR